MVGRNAAPVVAVLVESADIAAGSEGPKFPVLVALLDGGIELTAGLSPELNHLQALLCSFVG